MKNNTEIDLSGLACMRLNKVLELYPVSKSTWWQGVKDGRLPQPIRLGPRSVAWRVADIRALLEAK
jgi:prophage regulatory protein